MCLILSVYWLFSLPDVIELVTQEDTIPPYRPGIKGAKDKKQQQLVALMKVCWAEEPHIRPDFSTIKKRLKIINNYK